MPQVTQPCKNAKPWKAGVVMVALGFISGCSSAPCHAQSVFGPNTTDLLKVVVDSVRARNHAMGIDANCAQLQSYTAHSTDSLFIVHFSCNKGSSEMRITEAGTVHLRTKRRLQKARMELYGEDQYVARFKGSHLQTLHFKSETVGKIIFERTNGTWIQHGGKIQYSTADREKVVAHFLSLLP